MFIFIHEQQRFTVKTEERLNQIHFPECHSSASFDPFKKSGRSSVQQTPAYNIKPMENLMQQRDSRIFMQRVDSSESNQVYYSEYKRLYEHSVVLARQLRQTRRREEQLFAHIGQLSERAAGFRDVMRPEGERKKKCRRNNSEMHKGFQCPSARCNHRYGTQSSLRIHIKRKHPELYEPKRRSKDDSEQAEEVMESQLS